MKYFDAMLREFTEMFRKIPDILSFTSQFFILIDITYVFRFFHDLAYSIIKFTLQFSQKGSDLP